MVLIAWLILLLPSLLFISVFGRKVTRIDERMNSPHNVQRNCLEFILATSSIAEPQTGQSFDMILFSYVQNAALTQAIGTVWGQRRQQVIE